MLGDAGSFPRFAKHVYPTLYRGSYMLGLSYGRPIAVHRGRTTVTRTTFHRNCVAPLRPRHGKGGMTIVNTNPTKLDITMQLGTGNCRIALFSDGPVPKKLLHCNVPGFGLSGTIVSHHVGVLRTRNVLFGVKIRISIRGLPTKFSTCTVYANAPATHSLSVPNERLGNVCFTLSVLTRRGRVLSKSAFPGSRLIGTHNGQMLIVNNNSAKSSYVNADVHRKTIDMARVRVVPRPPVKRGPSAP